MKEVRETDSKTLEPNSDAPDLESMAAVLRTTYDVDASAELPFAVLDLKVYGTLRRWLEEEDMLEDTGPLVMPLTFGDPERPTALGAILWCSV